MRQITKYVFFITILIFSNLIYAGPFTGKANIYDPFGTPLVPGGMDITGNIDLASKTMTIDSWGPFFGSEVTTTSVELLDPGTYTRPGAGTVTVLTGQVGAYMHAEWIFNDIPLFMVWNVSDGGHVFTTADSDNDGVPGQALQTGPFPGFSPAYDFTDTGDGGPYATLSISTGGAKHECIKAGTPVTLTATPQLFNGAVLDSVSWTLNGDSIGTGLVMNETLALGSYTVTATVLTTTGQTATASASFSVVDTTRPVVTVAFIDNQGNEVTSAGPGQVTMRITATDSCDPNPVITSSTATPTTTVADGDILSINASLSNLQLPTTAIKLTAVAKDASGNFSLTTSDSSKTLILK